MKRNLHSPVYALIFLMLISNVIAQQPHDFKHIVVAVEENRFLGWPANNGIWSWEDEILVGFTQGAYVVKVGHNIGSKNISKLARSTDGGETWVVFDPENYVGDGGSKTPLLTPVDFEHPGFAMRVFGDKYKGAPDPEAGFFYSYDRGATWKGPHRLGDIAKHEEFKGLILTPRTDYVVLNNRECMLFISARVPNTGISDKIACIHTRDGGLHFEFVAWMVPLADPQFAMMPQTVQLSEDVFVSAIRRRRVSGGPGWIDACRSEDGGRTWSFYSRVGETGMSSGNPPALIALKDGRLCCLYGNRTKKQLIGRYSHNDGRTWGEEFVIRKDYYSGHDDQDLGYPRIVQRKNGRLIVVYYWASHEHPLQHIAASIWKP